MRTDDFAAALARGAGATEPEPVGRRYGTALGWGAFGATLLMAIVLGVRPDLGEAARTPMFWIKLAFPVTLGVAALVAACRLGRPGAPLGHVLLALAAPVGAMWLLALLALLEAPSGERASLVLGDTWDVCPYYIALLSVPAFVAAMWAMRGLAPTRPAAAGAISGLLAGTLGAAVYALHCPEMAPPFLGTWYLAGMLIPAAAGALVGARLFRW